MIVLMAWQSGCGYNNLSNYGTNGTVTGGTSAGASGLQERAFVSQQNPSSGVVGIQVVDAGKDLVALNSSTFAPFFVSLGGTLPEFMIPGANNTTLVFNAGDNGVSVVDNVKETLVGSEIQLPGPATSMVASTDGKFAYAAIPNISEVVVIALTASPVTVTPISTPIPGANRLVLAHNNGKLLAFSNDANQVVVINTSDDSTSVLSGTGFDQPTFAVFSSDDSKAYILNCGPECHGTQASITVLDMGSLTPGQNIPVDAATVGTADSSNLYIAGTNGTTGQGSATVIPLSSLAPGKPIAIGNGFHNVISLFQNKVLIGAQTCTTGCLSIVDAGAGSALVDPAKGDVSAIAPITPRTVFYAAEGGEVRVYDPSTGVEKTINGAPVIDIVGKVTGVVYVGPKT